MFDRSRSNAYNDFDMRYNGIYATPSKIKLNLKNNELSQPSPSQIQLLLSQSVIHSAHRSHSTIATINKSPKKKSVRLKKSNANMVNYVSTTDLRKTTTTTKHLFGSYEDLLNPNLENPHGNIDIQLSLNDHDASWSEMFGSLPKVDTNTYMIRSKSIVGKSKTKKRSVGLTRVPAHSTLQDCPKMHKLVKVYLSEKQSSNITECGGEFPCAPPATPTPEVLDKFQYIPCMTDIKAQRHVKGKLETIEKHEQRLLANHKQCLIQKQLEEMRTMERLQKQKQRLQIYALNKVMTAHEHAQFQKFLRSKDGHSNISHDLCDIP